jgi:Cu/Ag efflux pump CusA
MLDRIVDWAVGNRLLVVLGLLGVLAAGAVLIPRLDLDAFPDVTNVQVTVNTEARGLAAEEVEQLITYPIEAVMYALPDVEEVRSISKTGLSVVTVVFEEGTDIYFARQLVFERLQDAREQIPPGVGTPEMGPNTSGLGQVFQYILRTDDPQRFDAMALRSLNDWVVKLLLMPVEGVTDVLSYGGEVRQYQVLADPKRLLAQGLSIQDLAEAIEANNRNAGGWYLDRGPEQLVIRGVGWVRAGEEGLRDIGDIPLKEVDGVPVRVRDVAEVVFGGEIRQGAVTMTLREANSEPRQLGEVVAGIVLKRMGANTKAAREVGRPVFYAVIIIVVVFAPLFTLEGVEGRLFQPMAVSIVLAMLVSLVVALVVMPALASYGFRRGLRHRTSPVFAPLEWLYRRLLRSALKRRWLVVLAAFGLLAGALALVPRLGTEFVPELEEGTINIRVTLAPSASLETALEVAARLERALMEVPEVTYASSRVGRAELGGDPEPVSNIEIYVGLRPAAEWTTAPERAGLQRVMEEKMSVHPGLLFSFSQPIATRVDELLSGVKAQLAVKLFGPDLGVLADKGQAIETLVKSVAGARDVAMEQIVGESQLVVRPDRDRLARFGIPVAQVMDLVSDAIGGLEAGQVIRGNERYDIYVRLAQSYRDSADAIRGLILEAPGGAWIRLGDVASVAIESGPPQIRRDDVQRRVVIEANVEGRDMGGLVAELRGRIDREIDLPPGYSVVFGGQFENQQRAQARLVIVVPLSLGLIFLLLYFAFHSVGQALLIMLNVPLALIGGIAALYWTGQYLSVPGSIGFIALFGVAVLNGVVMVNAINQNLEAGEPMGEAVYRGALSRLRPVLMTAAIAALGLIPMLLATGVGSEVQRPLATVVVGGLASATFLTLFVLPSLFAFFSKGVSPTLTNTHSEEASS